MVVCRIFFPEVFHSVIVYLLQVTYAIEKDTKAGFGFDVSTEILTSNSYLVKIYLSSLLFLIVTHNCLRNLISLVLIPLV